MAFKHLLNIAVLLALVVCISSLSQQEKRIQKATALFLPVQHGPAKFSMARAMSIMNRRTVIKDNYLHVDLAPSFGKLDKESFKIVDNELKIIIIGTNIQLSKINPADRSWETVVSTMMQNPLTEPMDDVLLRSDRIIKGDTSWFEFSETTKKDVVNEVHSWFTKLIADEDILRSTKIDIDVMGKIVAHTGASVQDLWSLISAAVYMERDILDIGILRYPDIDLPYFKLYRIHLKAWADASRKFIYTTNSNGITGELSVRKFKPRSEEIKRIKDKIQKVVDQGVVCMFNPDDPTCK